MQPRDRFIQAQVLNLFKSLPPEERKLPVNMFDIISAIKNCKAISYKQFAEHHGIPISEVIQFCESKSGATHYNREKDMYIILFNDSNDNYNVVGRIRFTLAHEVGHVILGHLTYIADKQIANNNFYRNEHPDFEKEADWCASMILCPFPILHKLHTSSPIEIQRLCKLSTQASCIKYEQYKDWLQTRNKTAWENDMVKLFSDYINTQKDLIH